MAKMKPRRLKRSARSRRAKPVRRARKAPSRLAHRARVAKRASARRAVPKRGASKRAVPKRAVTKRAAPKRAVAKRAVAKRPAPSRTAPMRTARPATAVPPRAAAPTILARERRRLPDAERLDSNRIDPQLASSVRAGRNELRHRLAEHTESDPSLTAGDVDAKWEDAYAVGDEAPGGDNPTPGQDRVDDIGHALGVEYQDGEELKSSDKIAKRDQHRWELDPASSEDWPHGGDKD